MAAAAYGGAPGLIAWLDQDSMHGFEEQCYENMLTLLFMKVLTEMYPITTTTFPMLKRCFL